MVRLTEALIKIPYVTYAVYKISFFYVYNIRNKHGAKQICRMKSVIFINVLYLILSETSFVKGITKCESKIELRAVLLSCPTKNTGCDDDDPLTLTMKSEEVQLVQGNMKNFESYKEEKERGFPNAIKDCKRKLIITLKVKNAGKIPCDDEYIIVDHVFDPLTGQKERLLSPVVLKLRQEQMVQLYGLQFQRVVNSGPYEEQKEGDKVCSIDSDNPTCGIAMYDGKPIPFSEGFCCSCDENVNAKRQLSPISHGDTFLYRDSKLISQGNIRFVRDENSPGAIFDPHLLKLEQGVNLKEDENTKEESPIKELTSGKLPNYLFEHDKKIVCDKGDFLIELCKLQDEKSEFGLGSTNITTNAPPQGHKINSAKTNNFFPLEDYNLVENEEKIKDGAFQYFLPAETTLTDDSTESVPNGGSLNKALLLQNFIKALAAKQSSAEALQGHGKSVKAKEKKFNLVTRGKRENRQAFPKSSRKLSLDEKLERFMRSKNSVKNRRKRLLELSHKRVRKIDARCRGENQCETIVITSYPAKGQQKGSLPKYFFAHDKNLLDSPESSNGSCKPLEEQPDFEVLQNSPTVRTTSKCNNKTEESVGNYAIVLPIRKEWNVDDKRTKDSKKDNNDDKVDSDDKKEENFRFLDDKKLGTNDKEQEKEHTQEEKTSEEKIQNTENSPEVKMSNAERFPEVKVSSVVHLPEGKMTNAERFPEGKMTNAERFPEGKMTNAERFPEGKMTNAERFPEGKMTNAERFPEGKMTNAERFPEGKMPNAEHFPEEKMPNAEHNPEEKIQTVVHFPEGKMPNTDNFPEGKIQNAESFPEGKMSKAEHFPEEKTQNSEHFPEGKMPNTDHLPEERITNAEHLPEERIPNAEHLPEERLPNAEHFPKIKMFIRNEKRLNNGQKENVDEKAKENSERKNTDNGNIHLGDKKKNHFIGNTDRERKILQPKAKFFFPLKNRENQIPNANSDRDGFGNLYKKPSENSVGENRKGEILREQIEGEEDKETQDGDTGSDEVNESKFLEKLRKKQKEHTSLEYKNFYNPERLTEQRKHYKPAFKLGQGKTLHNPQGRVGAEGINDFDVEVQIVTQKPNPRAPPDKGNQVLGRRIIGHRNNGQNKEPTTFNRRRLGYSKSCQNPLMRNKAPQECTISEAYRIGPPRDVYIIPDAYARFLKLRNRNFPLADHEIQQHREQADDRFQPIRIIPKHEIYRFEKQEKHFHPPSGDRVPGEKEVNDGNQVFEFSTGIYDNRKRVEKPKSEVKIYRKHGFRDQEYQSWNREKREVGFSFETVRGFFKPELESLPVEDFSKNSKTLRELESCLPEVKSGENYTGWQLFRVERAISNVAKVENGKQEERLVRSYANAPDYVREEMEPGPKDKRQMERGRRSRNCDFTNVEDTAHCMRFADLWYSVYAIKKPVVAQIMGVQLFDKLSKCDGKAKWRDLTKGKMARIGTYFPEVEDDLPTISMKFVGEKSKQIENALDPDNYLLLIPTHLSDSSKINSYPQLDGGPGEYLVVDSKDLSEGGNCNMIGTSFEAFARQPDRCSQPRGSCLKRQPIDLWREDMEARIRGKRGKYFVENFGTIANSPIKTYTNFSGQYLALEYYGEYRSTIEIEVKADYNAIIRRGSSAQIPSVYIDGTYPKTTRIVLSVLNIGFTSSNFRPRLGDCPPELDPSLCPLEGSLVTIPPQQRHDFKLDLSGALPPSTIHVTVQVLNQMNKKVAYRRIIIKKGERCICAFHCKCNCIGNPEDGRSCRKLSTDEYRAAGYMGPFPYRGASESSGDSLLSNIQEILLTATYLLLLFGLIKGILGLFIRRVGISGTRVITGPRRLCGYYEYELAECEVVYDDCGFPIHPTNCMPVQIVPIWMEVLINIVIFFLYPLRGLCLLIFSLGCCGTVCTECDGCYRHEDHCGYDYDQTCSHPLLSKTVEPNCFNYNMTTINARKGKADEFLPCQPYKGDDDPLEEDDTDFVLREMKRYRKKHLVISQSFVQF